MDFELAETPQHLVKTILGLLSKHAKTSLRYTRLCTRKKDARNEGSISSDPKAEDLISGYDALNIAATLTIDPLNSVAFSLKSLCLFWRKHGHRIISSTMGCFPQKSQAVVVESAWDQTGLEKTSFDIWTWHTGEPLAPQAPCRETHERYLKSLDSFLLTVTKQPLIFTQKVRERKVTSFAETIGDAIEIIADEQMIQVQF